MIPFDFVYLRPDTAEEAVRAYADCLREGMTPFYFGGGTEIVTFARTGRVRPGAVIDIKQIPECRALERMRDAVVFGAGLPLNRVIDSGFFPLLEKTAGGVADHTVRNRLTFGGNIAGQLPYRETVLPLLLADAELLIAGPDGRRTAAIGGLFSKRLVLGKGELLLQVRVAEEVIRAPWRQVRREKGTRIDYPLLSVAVLVWKGRLRLAASGLIGYPFRDAGVEEAINRADRAPEERAEEAVKRLPAPVREDQRGSAEYRTHLFRRTVVEAIEGLEGKQ